MSGSNLSERLRDVIGARRPGSSVAVPRRAGHDPEGEPAPSSRSGAVATILGGEWLTHDCGRSFVIEKRVNASTLHGSVEVGDLASSLGRAASFASALTGGSPARPPFLFFDLETTGLNGGAGTLAFLVGCGWFDNDGGFVTRQHVLTEFGDEPGMLAAVAIDLKTAGALVTFNGKSFDAPVLETRYLFHRLEWPVANLPHLDVLHPSRRFWRSYSPDTTGCSLTSLEGELLGISRRDDIPGFEIPGRFFQFARSGDPRLLAAVLEHNRQDLLSLAAVTARLLCLLADGPDHARDAGEALALGRAYMRAGLDARASESFERVLRMMDEPATRCFASPQLRIEALRALAHAARRDRRHEAAAVRWRQVLDTPGCPRRIVREATEALAIHHEHRAGDLSAAKSFALQSLRADARPSWHHAVQHRLARIDRKIERTAGGRTLAFQF